MALVTVLVGSVLGGVFHIHLQLGVPEQVKRRKKVHELPERAANSDSAVLGRVEDEVEDGQHNLKRWV